MRAQEVETKKPKMIKTNVKTAIITGGVVTFLLVAFFARGLVIAATVNGSPISRLSVVRELEKQGGKSVLDDFITEKLIENEARKKGTSVNDEEIDAEMEKVGEQISAQGGTLAEALAARGMSEASFRSEIRVQQELEKLLADKVAVTDEEIQKYITSNKITIPKSEQEKAKEQIREQLKNQKLNQEAQTLITNLRNAAKIKYYINY